MNQREAMELIRQSKSLTQLIGTLKRNAADDILCGSAMRSFLDMRAREKGIPFKGTFELTPFCNLDCKMCYVHLSAEQMNGKKLLSAQAWERIMSEAIDEGMMYANITGGECLTSPDFDRLYLFLHSRGVQISILTNAVLLDEERVEFFRKHPPSIIQFTLYGANEDMYERVTGKRAFHRVIENVKRSDAAGLPIIMSITPNAYLGMDNEALIRFAVSMGIKFHVNAGLMVPREITGRKDGFKDLTTDDYMRLFRLEKELKGETLLPECITDLPKTKGNTNETPKGLRCGGGRSHFNVTWDGRLIPCNRLEHLFARPLECGFSEAWRRVNDFANNYPLPCECEGCPYQPISNTCAAIHSINEGHTDLKQCEWCRALVKAGLSTISANE